MENRKRFMVLEYKDEHGTMRSEGTREDTEIMATRLAQVLCEGLFKAFHKRALEYFGESKKNSAETAAAVQTMGILFNGFTDFAEQYHIDMREMDEFFARAEAVVEFMEEEDDEILH